MCLRGCVNFCWNMRLNIYIYIYIYMCVCVCVSVCVCVCVNVNAFHLDKIRFQTDSHSTCVICLTGTVFQIVSLQKQVSGGIPTRITISNPPTLKHQFLPPPPSLHQLPASLSSLLCFLIQHTELERYPKINCHTHIHKHTMAEYIEEKF